MNPLPRLLAVTTDAICRSPDFAQRVAAIAAVGPRGAILVRAPAATAAQHAEYVEAAAAVTRPHRAQLFVHARPDLARGAGAHGVQLRRDDLPPEDARRVLGDGWVGVAVHDRDAAEAAIAEGADFLVAGNVFATTSHPDRPAKGSAWLETLCVLGRPVIAIGGITPARAPEVRRAGAWGIAAISALWEAEEPGTAAAALLAPWGQAE